MGLHDQSMLAHIRSPIWSPQKCKTPSIRGKPVRKTARYPPFVFVGRRRFAAEGGPEVRGPGKICKVRKQAQRNIHGEAAGLKVRNFTGSIPGLPVIRCEK